MVRIAPLGVRMWCEKYCRSSGVRFVLGTWREFRELVDCSTFSQWLSARERSLGKPEHFQSTRRRYWLRVCVSHQDFRPRQALSPPRSRRLGRPGRWGRRSQCWGDRTGSARYSPLQKLYSQQNRFLSYDSPSNSKSQLDSAQEASHLRYSHLLVLRIACKPGRSTYS